MKRIIYLTIAILMFWSVSGHAAKVALHATEVEIAEWNSRRVNGPYKDEYDRIKVRADAFKSSPSGTWAGNTTGSCFVPSTNNPNRSLSQNLRDAAFVYMLTGDTTYSTPVKTKLLEQIAISGTDFSNTTKWCTNMSIAGAAFEIQVWLRRLVYAYDYIKPTLSAGEKASIETWLLNAGNYFNTVLGNRIKVCFPNRDSENYTLGCGSSIITSDCSALPSGQCRTHYNGNPTRNYQGVFANKETLHASTIAAIAVVLNNQTLIDASIKYAKEWLRFATFPDGSVFDQHRWINQSSSGANPGLGYSYASTTIGSAISLVDHLARAGHSLYSFSTSEGLNETVGGPKSFGLVVKRLAQMQQHLVNVYGSTDGSFSECERIDDNVQNCSGLQTHRTMIDVGPMAQSNVFYKESIVAPSYSRAPHSNPSSGGYDPFGGDWGNYSGARFMFGGMENISDAYEPVTQAGPAACVPTSATEQTCTNTLTWNWEQGTGPANRGFIMQRQIAGGEWLDLATRPTEKTMIDVVTDTVGGQTISYRVMAYYDDGGRTGPSNVASMVTPVISAGKGVSVTSKKKVLPSRRGDSGSSIVAVLLNATDNETVIQSDKQLAVSRRGDDGSSVVPILVNSDEMVTINGVVQ